jgi:hypothetical protein
MRKIFIFLSLIGLLLSMDQKSAAAKEFFDIPVSIVEVKDLGLSDRDESKSVIEVRWNANPIQKEKIVSFNLTLSITYADGTTVSAKRKIEKNALSARVEVPSVKTFGGRATAFIKKIDARVFAVISKN